MTWSLLHFFLNQQLGRCSPPTEKASQVTPPACILYDLRHLPQTQGTTYLTCKDERPRSESKENHYSHHEIQSKREHQSFHWQRQRGRCKKQLRLVRACLNQLRSQKPRSAPKTQRTYPNTTNQSQSFPLFGRKGFPNKTNVVRFPDSYSLNRAVSFLLRIQC